MATILEGLNAISQAVGGTAEAESNLEALNAISAALGGSADAENNADAIANIAENASGGGGGGDPLSLPFHVASQMGTNLTIRLTDEEEHEGGKHITWSSEETLSSEHFVQGNLIPTFWAGEVSGYTGFVRFYTTMDYTVAGTNCYVTDQFERATESGKYVLLVVTSYNESEDVPTVTISRA